MESWVFVEWSKANEWVQDVNFPSNMLYAYMLENIGWLYRDETLLQRSAMMKEIIRKRAYNGLFFTDHEIVSDDGYTNPGDVSEVCQYYAFFTGTATVESFPVLWDILCKKFGPTRKHTLEYQEIPFSNAFIGDYLRLEMLYKNQQYDQLLQDIKMFFAPMAKKTGTLWEDHQHKRSKCHGFASHVIYWLAGMYPVVRKDDSKSMIKGAEYEF